ncbi:cytochrome c [Mucilaginibacter pineti]|uniref:Cytochrome c n=1 Tax=Mucilaginibacter pineti TaxID=1391627 RepID=A0A1G6YJP9_9SPHI|nr:c-type cytochrome [Mucilaginibacter pineti]SDD90521.1 cytochrome c [Mucilaginibacter pineti]
MKKAFFILGICAVISACGGNASKSGNDTTSNQSAKAANSDADTNAVKTGTETAATEKVGSAAGEKLIGNYDCNTCHKVDVKIVGPAFQDVAKKYPATQANIDTLANKIINGGKGNWGDIPMAPHPTLAVADAKEIVKYILSLKK